MTKLQLKIESIIGPLYLVSSEKSFHGVYWKKQNIAMVNNANSPQETLLKKAAKQIEEYLSGKRKEFNLPLDAEGTDFQKQVWNELAKIPYGETRSYKQIAIAIKKPKAFRAVGTANGKNPLSLIVPCHRVIATGGGIGGYAGGLSIKKKLLSLEQN